MSLLARLGGANALGDAAATARLLAHLPGMLRRPIRPEQARAALQDRLERREPDFLTMAREVIYPRPSSPVRQLLALAGCEYGDLERLVVREGLEESLRVLFRQGVYLTVNEFKGRQPARRGSASIEVSPALLRRPGLKSAGVGQSSGSRGPRTRAQFDLVQIRRAATAYCVDFGARGGQNWVKAIWEVPGGSIKAVLHFSGFGRPLARWFSLVDAATPGLDPRYRLAERALDWAGRLAGVPLPRPEQVPLDDPLPIARWLVDLLRRGQVPHLYAFLSPAVRLCQAAESAGLDLAGAQLTVTGEPFTPARAEVIRRSGATAVSRYGSAEAGGLGSGCLAPLWSDEHHVHEYRNALIQAGPDGDARGLPSKTLLVSSLRAEGAFILLNVSTGDQATILRRDCSCPMERLGWTTHLHTIRSFEKLTAGGMTFLDVDVIAVLEELLPARFGGGPTHYQLVESEELNGRPTLQLLVHPAVGPLDETALAETFLAAIGSGSGVERVMGQVWRTPGLLRVERRPPLTTATGKIIHLHRAQPARR